MEMTFEQAEECLSAGRKEELARLMWDNRPLPDELTQAERVFCFGLYAFAEYEQRDVIRRYFQSEP
ncbi:MAG TPA: hypothetical protein H9698_06180 [Candidatus Ruthenibacterium merdavium]|uniref:Uncharacterized protein n=1 Tax=Candidatus Ruthenibacterium merdavium TaxID=2838752 RepID=A0A9D2Q5I4_9FIRM|nr:hypothetical protein [Candidatus Ruthenibacterium merdavium]